VATFIHADVDIKVQAERENKPEAEVIRELLSKGMKKSTGKAQESTGDSLLRLAE
jgi:peptidyl-tRNA hydrolase